MGSTNRRPAYSIQLHNLLPFSQSRESSTREGVVPSGVGGVSTPRRNRKTVQLVCEGLEFLPEGSIDTFIRCQVYQVIPEFI